MDVPLVLAQIEATRRTVTATVFGLIAVAAALALLTAWYWRVTDPRRNRSSKQTPPPRGKRRQDEPLEPEGPGDLGADSSSDRSAEHPMERVAGAGPDQTRVMDRNTILDLDSEEVPLHPPPPPTAAPGSVAAAARPSPGSEKPAVTAKPQVPVAAEPSRVVHSAKPVEEEIDLRPGQAPRATQAKGPRGAHDDGVSFDEWLALAEDD